MISGASLPLFSTGRDTLLLIVFAVSFLQLVIPVSVPYYVLVLPILLFTFWAAILTGRIPRLGGASLSLTILITVNAVIIGLGLLVLQRMEQLIVADLISAALAVALLLAGAQMASERRLTTFTTAFLWSVFLVAATGAILGFVKLYLFSRGVLIEWVLERSDGVYPWGTSWRADYNFYSLGLLCGAVASMQLYTQTRSILVRSALISGWLLIAGAGILSGSRRFMVLFPLLVLLELLMLHRHRLGRVFLRPALLFLVLGTLTLALVPLSQLGLVLDVSLGQLDLAARASSIVDTTDPSGLSQREALWTRAIQATNDDTFALGDGFRYLYSYGDEFAGGRHLTYPHNPILSAGLYGGFLAIVLTAAFYLICLVVVLRLARRSATGGTVGLLLFVGLAYLMVSGNTLFSIWSFLLLFALAALLCDDRTAVH